MYSKKVFINDEDNNYMVFMDRKLAREVAGWLLEACHE